jgi:tetratricopeptide (TPR) repeat protein
MTRGRLQHSVLFAVVLLLLSLPAQGDAGLQAAREDWQSGNPQGAIVRLKVALQATPDDAEARLLLGRIYLDIGDAAAAEQELMRARDAGADDFETRIALTEALTGLRQYARALEWTEAPTDASAAQRAQLLGLRGNILLIQGKESEAADAFRAATDADPNALRPMLGEASLQARRGDVEDARATIERAVATHPGEVDAWQALARLNELQGRPREAIEALTKAIELARSPWPLQYQRASLYLSLNQTEMAAVDIEAVRDQRADLPGLAYLDGLLALRRGEVEKAVEAAGSLPACCTR